MAKKSSHSVPIQKGPINFEDTSSLAFYREPQNTMRDMEMMAMRRSGQELTLHEPKR